MPSSLAARLKKLEAKAMATAAHPRLCVVWDDDPLPDDLGQSDQVIRVIYLPRKAASVEAWERQCRERFPHAPGDTP